MRAIVYKNLRRGDWSIAAVTGNDGRGKVIGHADSVCMSNARFVVKESARLRVCRVKQREVHAWVVGDICDAPNNAELVQTPITYNPYRCGAFTNANGAPVNACAYVLFAADGTATALGEII